MDDTKILDVFYNKIVPEATTGKIDCYFTINMAFDLIIDDVLVSKYDNYIYDGILIPTLNINNGYLFNKLLVKYVNKAILFYSEDNFRFLNDLDMLHVENKDKLSEEYLIKYIICTLFANASFKDFDDPINFLESRISMFDNNILSSDTLTHFGYLETIGANLYMEEEVCPIRAESPFRITCFLEFDDGYKLYLPEIYVGKCNDKYMLYGIQKTSSSNIKEERNYLKRIRKGMIAKINGAPEHYFLAVMLFLSLSRGKEIEVIPFLVERWNAKRIALINKAKKNKLISMDDIIEEQDRIQENITSIFIRYFTKLSDVTNGLNLELLPFELDSNLHVRVDDVLDSRSILFNELFAKANNQKSIKKLEKR